ncbi:MAG: uridine diphosphate-N-acetylglucosamine-binding protein YvcK [Acidobacteria bacterium]|nr:uridine diphosphate-N-acetylglucosamine-binding protein YvcK [Acidobacteriota bacterium]
MNVVAMGGGTGLSTLLKGLKKYVREEPVNHDLFSVPKKRASKRGFHVKELSAIVTVSDDGGSSGRLRREFQVLPPGDIRNCMVALSEDEALLSRLFQFRFASGKGLKGHSFGNLFLTALTGITGDFQEAVKVSGEVLAIRGHIFPSTIADVALEAVLEDGRVIQGETRIARSRRRISRLRLVPGNCRPLPQALEAIAQADVITVGPGSLYTSLIPNLLVRGVSQAIAQSRAAKIYICNPMTQPGETTRYTASDHVRAIYEHCQVPLFDYVVVNRQSIPAALRKRYLAERSQPVEADVDELEKLNVRAVRADLLASEGGAPAVSAQLVRHHPDRLARVVLQIVGAHCPTSGSYESNPLRKSPKQRAVF